MYNCKLQCEVKIRFSCQKINAYLEETKTTNQIILAFGLSYNHIWIFIHTWIHEFLWEWSISKLNFFSKQILWNRVWMKILFWLQKWFCIKAYNNVHLRFAQFAVKDKFGKYNSTELAFISVMWIISMLFFNSGDCKAFLQKKSRLDILEQWHQF